MESGNGFSEIDNSGTISSRSLTLDVSGNPYITGYQYNGLVNYGNGVSVAHVVVTEMDSWLNMIQMVKHNGLNLSEP